MKPSVRTPVWVVGAGGMIGSELVAQLGDIAHVAAPGLAWDDPDALPRMLDEAVEAHLARLKGGPPTVVWVAGTAVIGSDPAVHHAEVAAVRALLRALEQRAGELPGHLVLVSSAGGVYAGSAGPPFDEMTHPVPLSRYGESKLEEEDSVRSFAAATDWRVTIARLANVYGAGQSTDKQQGIVTRLCRAAVLGEPVRLFVPLTTTRHYVHVEDVGRLLIGQIEALHEDDEPVRLRVLSAGPAVSIEDLLALVEQVAATALPVHHELDPAAEWHGLDLRLATRFNDASLVDPLPLGTGIRQLLEALASGPSGRGQQ